MAAQFWPLGRTATPLRSPRRARPGVTRQIRAFEAREPWRPAVPILAIATMAVAPDFQLLVRVDLNAVLPKPTRPQSLESCVKRWCPQVVRTL